MSSLGDPRAISLIVGMDHQNKLWAGRIPAVALGNRAAESSKFGSIEPSQHVKTLEEMTKTSKNEYVLKPKEGYERSWDPILRLNLRDALLPLRSREQLDGLVRYALASQGEQYALGRRLEAIDPAAGVGASLLLACERVGE